MYSLNNYINTYEKEIKSIKNGTHKNNLYIYNCLVYLGNKQKIKIKINKKVMLAHKVLNHLLLKL